MKVLPFLLENEQQRQTAQRAGLTDVVLRAMVLFPNSVQLHIAAFHTIVLLARPLGGREGMLFHSSMILSGIFGGQNTAHPKSGIAVMVESMNRFEDNDVLQAMSCWALVNIALAPAQKAKLVKLGGIEATSNAMLRHPFSAEVQFRALFALINLVIPCTYQQVPFVAKFDDRALTPFPFFPPQPCALIETTLRMKPDWNRSGKTQTRRKNKSSTNRLATSPASLSVP